MPTDTVAAVGNEIHRQLFSILLLQPGVCVGGGGGGRATVNLIPASWRVESGNEAICMMPQVASFTGSTLQVFPTEAGECVCMCMCGRGSLAMP